jgi:uncharacterized protein YigE (DUF2233 family)
MGRLTTILLGLLSLTLTTISASAQTPTTSKISPTLVVTNSGGWKSIQKGIELRKIALERSEPSHTIDLILMRFDPQWVAPRLLRSAQFQLKGANVKTFAEKSGALAAINANYFDTEGRPLAFLKAGGQAINPRVSKSSLYTGVFGVKDQRPFIAHRDDFLPEQADEATQAGPLLLLRGSAHSVSGVPMRASRRALVAIDRDQKLIIAVTDNVVGGLHWTELQEIFSASQWQLQTPDLLNLDGGGSAQLYVKAGKFEEFIPGTSEVPVAIGFFTKGQ